MAEDFKIQVETDLDTSKAEQKLNALLKEKRQIKLDIDINNQNIKNISKNIEKGIKNTKIDTSAITKQLADSFNVSDKSVLKNLNKQLNSMISNLGKTWNGEKFDFGKATGFYSGLDNMAKTITSNSKIVKSATGYYDDFYNYFKNKKIYVSDDLKKALGGDTYKELLQNNIGKITKDAKKGISIDSLWGEMTNLFPEHFSQNITSNTAIATVSNGTISGKKPGSCQITVSTTDGSGISKTIAVTVTKKPDPPKPAIPSNKGGDGVPRVGDVVTFNGKYYYDSWGKRPAGSLYSGVKNGVVIDSYSSRDYGGSARYTGDLKVHIKSRDGRYGDLGWVRLSQISGYAKGTPGVDRDQIAIVDEEGRELQIPNGKGGRITKLEKSTGVIPHTPTEKLMALSEQLDNNGNMVINGRTIEEYINDMANMQSIAVPDFSDVTASVVSQLEGKGMGNVTVENHYDSLLTVEGNVDKDALPGLEDILKRSYEYTSKQMVKELRKGGMQIRR